MTIEEKLKEKNFVRSSFWGRQVFHKKEDAELILLSDALAICTEVVEEVKSDCLKLSENLALENAKLREAIEVLNKMLNIEIAANDKAVAESEKAGHKKGIEESIKTVNEDKFTLRFEDIDTMDAVEDIIKIISDKLEQKLKAG